MKAFPAELIPIKSLACGVLKQSYTSSNPLDTSSHIQVYIYKLNIYISIPHNIPIKSHIVTWIFAWISTHTIQAKFSSSIPITSPLNHHSWRNLTVLMGSPSSAQWHKAFLTNLFILHKSRRGRGRLLIELSILGFVWFIDLKLWDHGFEMISTCYPWIFKRKWAPCDPRLVGICETRPQEIQLFCRCSSYRQLDSGRLYVSALYSVYLSIVRYDAWAVRHICQPLLSHGPCPRRALGPAPYRSSTCSFPNAPNFDEWHNSTLW